MQLPDILNVALGLIVLFLLLSTIASVLAEIYGRALRYREEILYVTINRLLTGLADPPWSHGCLLLDRLVNEALGYLRPGSWIHGVVKSFEPSPPRLPLPTGDDEEDERCMKIVEAFWSSEPLRATITPGCDAPERLAKEAFADVLVRLTMPLDSRGTPPEDRDTLLRCLETCSEELPRHLRQVLAARAKALGPGLASGPGFGAAFRDSIMAWYEEAMARAAERYRRLMQRWLLWIGLVLAVALNADAVRVIYVLGRDPTLAKQIASEMVQSAQSQETEGKPNSPPNDASHQATQPASGRQPADNPHGQTHDAAHGAGNEQASASKQQPSEADRDPEAARKELSATLLELQKLERLGFPLGWTLETDLDYAPGVEWVTSRDRIDCWPFWGSGLLFIKLLGLAITVLAVSQGAPFWYDLLQKLSALRRGSAPEVAVAATGSGPASASIGGTSSASTPPPKVTLSIGPDLASGAPGYEPRRAYWLAEFANRAYAVESDIRRFARDKGFPRCAFWSRTDSGVDTQVFAVADGKVAVVAFRGTEPDVMADIVSDLRILREPAVAGDAAAGEIHRGFGRAEAVVADKLVAWLETHAPENGIVHVTGHSLGGALATVFAARLTRHPKLGLRPLTLHTFGCPRVGDEVFTRRLDRSLGGCAVRFVHGHDPVPMVPPAVSGGYRHLGLEICFLKPTGLRRSPGGLDRLLGLAADAAINLQTAGRDAVADHAMDDYIARCRAETGAAPA